MQAASRRFLKLGVVLLPVILALVIAIQPLSATQPGEHTHHTTGVPLYTAKPADLYDRLPVYESRLLAAPSDVGQWSQLYTWPIVAVHISMMPDGKLLMWDVEKNSTTTARLWDPAANTFTAVPLYPTALFCAAHVLLPDGRLIVNGGHLNKNNYGTNYTHLFDPRTQSWTQIADMAYKRWYPSTIIMGNGGLVTFGGSIVTGQMALIPEVFNPANNTWTQLTNASMDTGQYPKAHLLPTGEIFFTKVAGGRTMRFNVQTQTWTHVAWAPVGFTSVQYEPGKFMYAGKGTITSTINMNLTKPYWANRAAMAYPRHNQSMVILPDGQVLAIGGSSDGTNNPATAPLMPELWNPVSMTWRQLTPMSDPRMYHSIGILLPDGRVLSAGGGHSTDSVADYFTAQIYSPPYLFKGARPTITYAPSSLNYGSTINVQTPDASSISKVAFIRLPSFTHAYDMNQVYIPATFTKGTSSLQVQVPSNNNIMAPGYYMMFIINSNGVPSVAKIMQIGDITPIPPSNPTTTAPPPTLPPNPTPTRTPTPTPTPSSGQTTITAQIISGNDDVNEDGSTYTPGYYGLWLGTGANPNASYAGLRFTNLSIPRNATIVSAQLQVYSPTSAWVNVNMQIAGDAAGNSAAFSSTSRPSQRTALTTARVTYNDGSAWSADTWYTVTDVQAIVQEIVRGTGWNSGNSLSLILRANSGTANVGKYALAQEGNSYYGGGNSRSIRLVITYRP